MSNTNMSTCSKLHFCYKTDMSSLYSSFNPRFGILCPAFMSSSNVIFLITFSPLKPRGPNVREHINVFYGFIKLWGGWDINLASLQLFITWRAACLKLLNSVTLNVGVLWCNDPPQQTNTAHKYCPHKAVSGFRASCSHQPRLAHYSVFQIHMSFISVNTNIQ